jgi:hypothetical protein
VANGVQEVIGNTSKAYPAKRRILSALGTMAALLIVSWSWRFEWAKIFAISAFTAARLFDVKGRWFAFFSGLGLGDLLLYFASPGHLIHR